MEVDDTWAWVAMGPERQPDDAVGALAVAEDVHAVDEGLSDGAHLQHSRDAPGRGLVRQAPPQHSRTHNSQTHDPSYLYLLIKPGSKFSTIVHEYTEPSRIFTLKARMEKRDDFKCVEAENKSNLKTSL
ncbi:hypothetical protein Tco_0021372 [Tanacetum coccineum]